MAHERTSPAALLHRGLPRSTPVLVLLLVVAAVLSGCGDEQVTVPAQPERVLPLTPSTLDATVALGIEPVGLAADRGARAVPSYLRARAPGVARLSDLGARDLEQIQRLAPDVILLDVDAGQDEAVIDKLRQVAPTIAVSDASADWRDVFVQIATQLGRAADGADVLAAYDQRVNETKLALRGRTDQTVSVVGWDGKGAASLPAKTSLPGQVFTDLGLAQLGPNDRTGAGQLVSLSLSQLDRIDADWIFFGALPGGASDTRGANVPAGVDAAVDAIESAQGVPEFRRLRAFRARHVVPVDASAWTSPGGPIAANVIVADVARNLGAGPAPTP